MKKIIFITLLFTYFVYAQNASMSMTTYKRLQNIEELIGKDKYDDAQVKIDRFLKHPPKRSVDKAYLFYTAGMFYLQKENLELSYKYILEAYKLKLMPEVTTLNMLNILAGINMENKNYTDAIKYYKEYIKLSKKPKFNSYNALAIAYYFKKEYNNTIVTLNKMIELFPPQKNTYLMLFSSQYELNKLKDATSTLEKMVTIWDMEKKYWLQLISILNERKEFTKALEILQMAYTKNFLTKENDILQYVYILYEKKLPFKAATILEKNINTNVVKANKKNYELLSTLYQEAKELSKAIEALKNASKLSNDGKNDLYIAQLYYDQENQFNNVITYAKNAIKKGIKQEGSANMLIAISYNELEDKKNTIKYLKIASKYEKTKKSAQEWLKSL